jgi:hypothetical protein
MSVGQTSGGRGVKQPEYLSRRWQLWWTVRVGRWLCGLPLRWRLESLPGLLQRLTPARGQGHRRRLVALDQCVRIVRRICRLWLFCGPLLPPACLRPAVTFYAFLSRLGYRVAIHFGIYKAAEALRGPC